MTKTHNFLLTLVLAICMVFAFIPALSTGVSADEGNYLTFRAGEDNSTVSFKWISGEDVQIRVSSTDDKIGDTNSTTTDWQDYTAGTTITLTNACDQVQFKGKNISTSGANNNKYFYMSGKIFGAGDVTSLTNGVGGDAVLTAYCYENLFEGCTALITPPGLPSTTLAEGCYSNMFCECSNLTETPQLPATVLAPACYFMMFSYCTSLTVPAMMDHVTNVATSSCTYMYYECNSIKIYTDKPSDNCISWLATKETTTYPGSDSSIYERLGYWAYYMFTGCAGAPPDVTGGTTYYIVDDPRESDTGTVFTDNNILIFAIIGAVLVAAAIVVVVLTRKRKANR